MTRGIHLKHLTSTDLGLLGLPESALPTDPPKAKSPQVPTLAEADPALAKIVTEVRDELQLTLAVLQDALAGRQTLEVDSGGDP
jgi:hypothetical protein